MDIGVIGINHKLADLSLREALAKACQRHFNFVNGDHQPHHFLLLSTCNRTEVYFSSPLLSEAQSFVLKSLRDEVDADFDQKLYSFFKEDCFHHLCKVTAGLDSAVLAETEIQGQVKLAYEAAAEQDKLPGILHFAFQKALKVGKAVRTSLPLTTGMPSLEQAILTVGNRFFKGEKEPRILFIGASHINGKVIDHFQRRGFNDITISNRSIGEANRWASKYGINILDWSEKEHWLDFDWIIFGTRAPQPLLTKTYVPDDSSHLIIDLSVPRNVDPAIGQLECVSLYNIDQLNRSLHLKKRKLQLVIQEAEQRVMIHCQRLVQCYSTKHQWIQRSQIVV